MTYRKKLIEVALPLEAINVASAREKSIRHGHPSTLHLWWARRPLAAARAVIFSSLVDDPDSPDALPAFVEACKALPKGKNAALDDTPRQRLFDFIELLVQWESTTDEAVLNTARELIMIATEGNPPPLLDPFAGGGSIPLEAQRLGLEAHASDLNPVAVMINKAQIEIPPRFANMPPVNPRDRQRMNSSEGWKGAAGLAADVRYYGEWMREKAWERIGHLYPTHNGETVIAWLWARTVKSPNPAVDVHVPLVRSFELSKKKGRQAWIEPQIHPQTKKVSFVVRRENDGDDIKMIPDGTMNRRGGTCLVTGVPIPFEYIRAEGKAGRICTQLMAIVTEGQNGRNYYASTLEHEKAADVLTPDDAPDSDLPEQALGFRVQNYGLTKHKDLFTARQLTALCTFSDLVAEARQRAYEDAIFTGLTDDNISLRDLGQGAKAYSEAVGLYLAFVLDKGSAFWSNLAFWLNQPKNEVVGQVFGRQTISMVWDFAEVNLFSSSGGNWLGILSNVTKCIEFFNSVDSYAEAIQADAAKLAPNTKMIISTDPPYYDNIGYADLSDYFYVWLRRSLRSTFPDIFDTLLTPKATELIAAPHRFNGDRDEANRHFESGLEDTFVRIRNYAASDYPLSVYYAFKQAETSENEDEDSHVDIHIVSNTGWETILESLVKAGFTIDGTWPIRTERPGRMRDNYSNALASSIILVCRPRPDDAPTLSRRAFVDALRRELPAALKNMQSGNIAPVDLAQASIGPGMAIYSRYSKVLEADGTAMSVRAALGLINQELDTYLSEQDGDIDADTRFAVSWFEQFGFNEGDFGQADVLARAKNTSVAGVTAAGVVESSRGKVRLIHWHEYDTGALGVNFVLGKSKLAWSPEDDKRATIWEATHNLIERLNTHGEGGAAQLMTKMPHDMAAEARNLAYRLYSICERKGWAEHARDYNALVISWAEVGDVAARLRESAAVGDATVQGRLFE